MPKYLPPFYVLSVLYTHRLHTTGCCSHHCLCLCLSSIFIIRYTQTSRRILRYHHDFIGAYILKLQLIKRCQTSVTVVWLSHCSSCLVFIQVCLEIIRNLWHHSLTLTKVSWATERRGTPSFTSPTLVHLFYVLPLLSDFSPNPPFRFPFFGSKPFKWKQCNSHGGSGGGGKRIFGIMRWSIVLVLLLLLSPCRSFSTCFLANYTLYCLGSCAPTSPPFFIFPPSFQRPC